MFTEKIKMEEPTKTENTEIEPSPAKSSNEEGILDETSAREKSQPTISEFSQPVKQPTPLANEEIEFAFMRHRSIDTIEQDTVEEEPGSDTPSHLSETPSVSPLEFGAAGSTMHLIGSTPRFTDVLRDCCNVRLTIVVAVLVFLFAFVILQMNAFARHENFEPIAAKHIHTYFVLSTQNPERTTPKPSNDDGNFTSDIISSLENLIDAYKSSKKAPTEEKVSTTESILPKKTVKKWNIDENEV